MAPENTAAAAITTLKQAFSSLSDFSLHFFNQLPSPAHLQQKCSHLDQQYNLTAIFNSLLTSSAKTLNHLFSTGLDLSNDMQQKWTRIDAQYNLTATTIHIFKQSIHFLNKNVLTAEMAARFVITVLIFVVLALGLICLCGFVGTVIRLLCFFISSVVGFLFRFVSAVFKFVLSLVLFVVWCLWSCLWFGGKGAVKMMKAPGKPGVIIARTSFEANPQEYFSNLRGRG